MMITEWKRIEGSGKHELLLETEGPSPMELHGVVYPRDPERILITLKSGRRIYRFWASAISDGYDDGAYLMLGEHKGPWGHEGEKE